MRTVSHEIFPFTFATFNTHNMNDQTIDILIFISVISRGYQIDF